MKNLTYCGWRPNGGWHETIVVSNRVYAQVMKRERKLKKAAKRRAADNANALKE